MPFDPNDPDTKAALEAAVTKATDALQGSIDKLEAKNEELVGDLRKAKQAARAAGEIKPEDVQKLEDQLTAVQAELDSAKKDLKSITTERDKAVKALESETGFSTKMLTENALATALSEAGVTVPGLLAGAKSLFGGQATVAEENGQRVVKIGDKAAKDAIAEWAKTEDAKHYITAQNNSGGGAGGGGGGGGSGRTITRAQFDALDPAGRMAFSKDGGKLVDEAA